MKAISFVEAKDIIGGALNPFAGLVKGAQLGYDTGASIMVGGVVGGILGGAMGFWVRWLAATNSTNRKTIMQVIDFKKHRPSSVAGIRCCCPSGRERRL